MNHLARPRTAQFWDLLKRILVIAYTITLIWVHSLLSHVFYDHLLVDMVGAVNHNIKGGIDSTHSINAYL